MIILGNIITYLPMWFAFNTLVTIKKIEKLTQVGDSKKPINSLSLGLYFILFVIGPFGFFFIKKIKKIRYEKYLKDKLFYYNWSNTSPLTPLGKKIFKDINRQLKLIKLEREARINKIKHLINPFK